MTQNQSANALHHLSHYFPHECGPGCTHDIAARLDRAENSAAARHLEGLPDSLAADLAGASTKREAASRRILLKGGTIVSMDAAIGDFAKGDVLIEGDRIAAVGAHIEAQAETIDASGKIVIPGFCDPHIHAWQGNLARLIPDNTSSVDEEMGAPLQDPHPTRSYRYVMHHLFAPHYRPEDIYIGTLMSLLSALDGGITTVCDNAHNSRSAAHSDASIAALGDSGVRGVHAYGRARFGEWDRQFPDDAYRIAGQYFASEDQLTTFRLFMPGRDSLEEMNTVLKVRKDLDVWMTFDSGIGIQPVAELYADGRFYGKETINHGTFVSLEKRKILVANGAKINVCPRIETQFRYGDIPYQDWRDLGHMPAISNDDPATYAINMFREMQTLYAFHRALVHRARMSGATDTPALSSVREMLEAATIRGAENCGLDHKVGSLTPGKQADIVLIDAQNVHLYPIHSVVGTLVQGADVGFVDTVFVAGRIKKWRGNLLGVDFDTLRNAVDQSCDHLFAKAQWPLERIDLTH